MTINHIQRLFHNLRREGKRKQACYLAATFRQSFCFSKDELITVFVTIDFDQHECESYLEEIWHAKF